MNLILAIVLSIIVIYIHQNPRVFERLSQLIQDTSVCVSPQVFAFEARVKSET